MAQILLVEDDTNLADTLEFNITRWGHEVIRTNNGAKALELFERYQPDLILLDLLLPGLSGMEVCTKIRKSSTVPIIMLTARDSETDKVRGLEAGADDYITKPFSIKELQARINSVLRRSRLNKSVEPASLIKLDNFEMDRIARKVKVDGAEIKLTQKEFDLLELFLLNPGKAFSRYELLERVWGNAYAGESKTVDVHIRWLRSKFGNKTPFSIVTLRGIGYRLDLELKK
jgi:two-component system response regulator RegX3